MHVDLALPAWLTRLAGLSLLPSAATLSLLHYSSPVALLLCLAASRSHLPPPTQPSQLRRRVALTLTTLVAAAYAAEAFLLLSSEPQHRLVYTLGSLALWMGQAILLSAQSSPVWQPFQHLWVLATITDYALAYPAVVSLYRANDGSATASVVTIAVRSLLLALVNLHAASLTKNGNTTTTNNNNNNDNNSWLKTFWQLVPFLWPSGNVLLQLSLAGVVVCLVAERYLNIMLPDQFGVLINSVSVGYFPAKELGLLILYSWLHSWAGLAAFKHVLIRRVTNWSQREVSLAAFNHVLDLSVDYHDSKDTGDAIRSIEQAMALNRLLELALIEVGPVVVDMIVGIAYLARLVDAWCALTMATSCVLYIYLTLRMNSWSSSKRVVSAKKSRTTYQRMYAALSSWYTVTYFGRQAHERQRFGTAVDEDLEAKETYENTTHLMSSAQDAVLIVSRTIATALAAWRVFEGSRPVGTLVAIHVFWARIDVPLWTLAKGYRKFNSILIDAAELLQLLQRAPAVRDGPRDLRVAHGRVEFAHVNFGYDSRKQILRDVSFTAQPGQTIALVGETGSGKSTVLKLLLRFYDASAGCVKIDGQDVRDVSLASLRNAFGIVPQDPSMFNDSIMENVRYARLDASDDEVIDACREAAVHDKIMSFPDGYQTTVGENGVKLSGGELQRIAIARVILRRAKIILLDEATSAVDSLVENRIQKTLKKLCAGCTTFVVAHRLSTIVHADQIFVVDKGEIIERGTHQELLRRRGRYNDLWTMQTAAIADDEDDEVDDGYQSADTTSSSSSSSLFSASFSFTPQGRPLAITTATTKPNDSPDSVVPSPRTARADSLGEGLVNMDKLLGAATVCPPPQTTST